MPRLFPRYLRLILAQNDGEQVDLGRLSCKFEIVRESSGGYCRAKATIYNLSQETIAKLQQKYVRMRLDAGHEDRNGTIFEGDINFAFTTRDGADRVTDLFAVSGLNAMENGTVNLAFRNGTSLRSLVRSVIETFSKIENGPTVGDIEIPDAAVVGAGVVSGQTKIELDQLSKEHDFRWVIDNNQVRVFGRGRVGKGGPAITVSKDTGLIASPIAFQDGIEFTTLLDPRLKPWQRVSIESFGPSIAASDRDLQLIPSGPPIPGRGGGLFDIARLVHVGESRGQAWYTTVFALPQGMPLGSEGRS